MDAIIPTLAGALVDVATAASVLPISILLIGHCLFVASLFKGSPLGYLVHYWLGLITAFGGGLVTAVLFQVRCIVSPS
jgi:hypothetical protein